MKEKHVLFVVSEDWYFVSHRLALATMLIESGHRVTLVTRVDRYERKLKQAGIRVVPFSMNRRGMNPFGLLREAWSLRSIFLREAPDLVHSVSLRTVVVGALAARISGVRCHVAAITGLGFLFAVEARHRLVIAAIRACLSQLLSRGHVIVQNPEDRGFLRRLGLPDCRLHLIPGAGVDVVQFHPGAGEIFDVPVVMQVSRLLWDKGVGEFVAAAQSLADRARFVLVGGVDSDNPSGVDQEVLDKWKQDGIVEILGPRSDVPEVLRTASVFCLPSYREGMPKALLEAMATGVPCVTTDTPGCRDAVEDGVTGLLVPVRDERALAQAIERLLDDVTLQKKLGSAARSQVVDLHAVDKINAATLKVYRICLDGLPGGHHS